MTMQGGVEEQPQQQMLSGEYDVVVIGAGIIGSCTAYQLAKSSASVVLLEQFDLLHRRGSSHGETRTIRLTYPEPYYTAMVKQAWPMWAQAEQEAGYLVHTSCPHLDMAPKDSRSLQALLSSCKQHGVPTVTLTAQDASVRFPTFQMAPDWMGVVTEQGGVIHATKAVAMFQWLAAKYGAIIRDRVKVRHVHCGWKLQDGSRDGVLVSTNRGSVLASKCIIAAGAWTPQLVKQMCGLELPIQPLHTTLAYWQIQGEAVHEFSPSAGFPSFASCNQPYIYGSPSVELPGLLKVSYHSGYKCDPDKRSLAPDLQALKQIVSPWLETHFKGKIQCDAGPVIAEACMYSMTPDQDFILDFLPEHNKRILLAAGFSGHGFKMGPLIGRVMADLCLHEFSDKVPLELFSLSRFSRNPKGNLKSFEEQVVIDAKAGIPKL